MTEVEENENENVINADDIVLDDIPQGAVDVRSDPEVARPKNANGQVPPQGQGKDQSLKIATIGSMEYANFLPYVFENRNFVVKHFEDIDKILEWQPSLTFVCMELPMKSNGLQDDTDFLTVLQKLEAHTQGGICIKSVLSPDTMGRVLYSLQEPTLKSRVIYNPELVESSDLKSILSNTDHHLVAGSPDAISAHMSFCNLTSLYTFGGVVQVGLMEGAVIKLANSAYRAVKQTFFNQLKDVAEEYSVSPSVIRKSAETLKDSVIDTIPTFIRAQSENGDITYKKARTYQGEYDNYDVGVFVGMTDKLPLLDECVNYRNIKEA
jgi:hypothetical protein